LLARNGTFSDMNDKPEFLYHGSAKGIDGSLAPRLQRGDLNGEFPDGPQELVFASSDKNTSMLYTLKTPGMLSVSENKGTIIAVLRDYEGWKKDIEKSSAALYTLPPDSFENTIRHYDNVPTGEWKSPQTVQPIKTERVTPEMVMQAGGQ
jgi:hypothetical protein